MSTQLKSARAIITSSTLETITVYGSKNNILSSNRLKKSKRYFLGDTGIRLDNILRTRSRLRRMIRCNTDLCKFVTLTFNTSIIDLKIANKKFAKFVERATKRYPDFKYIAVPEFQKKGRVHYHLLVNVKEYINSDEFEKKIWRNGFCKTKKLRQGTRLDLYLSKYMSKDIDKRLFSMRRFFYSFNCLKPLVLTLKNVYDILEIVNKFSNRILKTFSKEINFTWGLTMYYNLYDLKRSV